MKRSRWIPQIALLLFALLLSGCINIQQEYWLYEDGSAKVGMDIGMSEALLSMGANSGSGSTTSPFEDLKSEYNASNPNIKNVTVREYTDKDLKHFEVTFEVPDFEEFLATESSKGSEFNITLTRNADKSMLFKQITQLDAASETGGMDLDSMGEVFKDMYWLVKVHVPQVISTNGEKLDNSTVQWKIPMADIFAGKAPGELTMLYKPQGAIGGGGIFGGTGSGGANWGLWLIVGIVLLAIAAGAAYYFLVYRKRPAPVSATFGAYPPVQGYPPAQGNYPPQAVYPPQWGAQQPQQAVPLPPQQWDGQPQPGVPPQWDAQPQPGLAPQAGPLPPPQWDGQSQPGIPPQWDAQQQPPYPQQPPAQYDQTQQPPPVYPDYPQYTQAPQYPPGPSQGSDYYPAYPPQQPPAAQPPAEPPAEQPDEDAPGS